MANPVATISPVAQVLGTPELLEMILVQVAFSATDPWYSGARGFTPGAKDSSAHDLLDTDVNQYSTWAYQHIFKRNWANYSGADLEGAILRALLVSQRVNALFRDTIQRSLILRQKLWFAPDAFRGIPPWCEINGQKLNPLMTGPLQKRLLLRIRPVLRVTHPPVDVRHEMHFEFLTKEESLCSEVSSWRRMHVVQPYDNTIRWKARIDCDMEVAYIPPLNVSTFAEHIDSALECKKRKEELGDSRLRWNYVGDSPNSDSGSESGSE